MNAAYPTPAAPPDLTKAEWALLNEVNSTVNQDVRYESDEQQFGQPDYWVPAKTAGDCEDFALAKRQLLWAAGWPTDSTRLALVWSERTGSHAVLIADTSNGAYVLDNSVAWILPWSQTDYRWIQAQDQNGAWHMAGPSAHAVLVAEIAAGHVAAVNTLATAAPASAANVRTNLMSFNEVGTQITLHAQAPAGASGGQVPDLASTEPGGR